MPLRIHMDATIATSTAAIPVTLLATPSGWTGPPVYEAVVLKYIAKAVPDRIAQELEKIIAAPDGAEDTRRGPMRRVPRRVVVWLAVLLLSSLSPGVAAAAGGGGDPGQACRQGDRGRLLRFERVASHPTAADARAYFDTWVDFYRTSTSSPRIFPPASPMDSTATR